MPFVLTPIVRGGEMQAYPIDVVAIGASAGGVEALSKLLRALPADLPAAVLVTLHRPVARDSQLHRILAHVSRLPVVVARQGERLRPGKCYLGSPSHHLTVGPGMVANLVHNGFYRAHNIDLLFSSLARNAGKRTIGVVLSGLLKDGTQGLVALKEAGGKALVQSPGEASFKDMPRSAIEFDGAVDRIAPIDELAQEICRLVHSNGRGDDHPGPALHSEPVNP
jgi:two-component system chemotaxis response regulator CheB